MPRPRPLAQMRQLAQERWREEVGELRTESQTCNLGDWLRGGVDNDAEGLERWSPRLQTGGLMAPG